MPKHLLSYLVSAKILRAPEDGAGGGGSFFQPGEGQAAAGGASGGEGAAGGDGGQAGGAGDGGAGDNAAQRPEWLLPKYKTPEDQAKAYSELYGQFSKKTEDLRKEVMADAVKEYGKTVGVPEKPDAYAYPEGFKAPAENVDQALRDWAHKNNVGAEAFQALVKDVHGLTQANAEVELGKLGDNAMDRIKAVSAWVTKNVDKAYFGQVERIMTTAEGVAFMEAIMGERADAGFAPDGNASNSNILTRDEIRKMQEDPRWGTDDAYSAQVRAHWQAWANLPIDKRK